jgi:hypothetical protein
VSAFLLVTPVYAFAAAPPQFKQLAGPPTEMSAMAPADPANSATHSKSALLRVALQKATSGRWTWSSEVPVESDTLRFAVLSANSVGTPTTWSVMTRDPITGRTQSAEASGAEHRATMFGLSESGIPADSYAFKNLSRGNVEQISIESDEPGQGFILIEGAGPARLLSHQAAFNQRVGQRIGLVARIYDRDKGLHAPGAGSVSTALLRLTTPDGRVLTSAMLDDGLHADGQAGDGVYGGDFVADTAGQFNAQVVFEGKDSARGTFVRTAEHLIPVVEDTISLDGQVATSTMVADRRVGIRLGVAAPVSTGHYHVFAEVWGSDASGGSVSIPVAWIGGMTTIRDGAIDLGLDTRWITMAGAREPFELRNVRIEDPDYFITLAAADRVPLPVPPALEAAGRLVADTNTRADQSRVDEEMLMGPRPAHFGGEATTNATVPPAYTGGTGHKLLLVHGYCSSDVWGPVQNQFTNAYKFLEVMQNRSHDAFAGQILADARSFNSYAIVAHSQGGAAALHLYTYYWSGLDNAGPGRLIQSVGTPYQGTNLSAILAALGSLFGQGCGPQWDLTYDGAAVWLASIPAAARAKVNYYTTSAALTDFWPCKVPTDLFLDFPNDGVTERAYGQLPNASNQGHTTSWCHTDTMNHPAQTTDSARNAVMNAQAAIGTDRTLSVVVNGNGSVSSNPAGISNCTGTCAANYPTGTEVTLTANAAGGSTFAGWGGYCYGSSTSCVVSMGAARSVTATFTGSATGPYTLTVTKAGTGSGTVTSSPTGISCGSTCSKSYASGTVVTLTASPAGGSTFAGWGGACGAAGSCTVSMSAARSVTATFTLTVTPPGNTGSLIVAPGGIDVYWRQNNHIYHVTDKASVVDVMENAGMPGWVWASRTQVSSLAGYTVGPEFIEGNSRSEGLLIRQVGQNEVYWVNNGLRRWVACEAALPYLGTFADVIDVPAAIFSSKVPSRGSDFNNGCPCAGFSIFPSSPPSNPGPSAGSQLVNVTGVPWGCAGTWTASGDGQWLSVDLSSGTLSGTNTEDWVNVSWSANTSPSSRSSSATVADHGFPVTQSGVPPPTCSSFSISPPSVSAESPAGSRLVTITGWPSGCQGGSWSASGNGSWLTVSQPSGSGAGSVTVWWSQNATVSSRWDSATVAGNAFTVFQTPLPSVSISDVSVTEGNAGMAVATFTVDLSEASSQTVTVGYTTANGTATAGADYVATSGSLTFNPGVKTQSVTVSVIGDATTEADETFFVNLSGATNATIADSQGVGTITNDDGVSATSPTIVSLQGATSIGQTSATVGAIVNPNGSATTVYFDYGTTASYGSTVSTSAGSGASNTAVVTQLTGLSCNTLYYYRARASNVGGSTSQGPLTFSTLACSGLPWLQLTHPNGGETLEVGSSYTIRWTAANLDPSGDIQINYNDGGNWQLVTGGLAPSATQYTWTVPQTVAPAIGLFIGNAVGGNWEVSDMSDQNFLVTRATSFYTLAPCRVLDTRQSPLGALGAGVTRRVTISDACGIPTGASAVVVNVTVTEPTANGNLRFFPAGLPVPTTSTLNYAAGQTRANNATLVLGNAGAADVLCSQASGTAHVIVDVSGYYQ